jgi:hypothetical protein
MPLHRFKRPKKPLNEPLVSIRDGRFHFNAHFAKLAELQGKRAVLYSTDDETREIGFEFFQDSEEEDAYTLEDRGGTAKFRCAAQDLISKKPWIKSVASQTSSDIKRFRAKKRGRLWIIQLMPSFEFTITRDRITNIPADLRGIYRYRTDSGEIVYIGKGEIRGRASDPTREEWAITAIDYSIIESEEDQFSFEAFWIERFREQNEGRLPYYNRQSGNRV